MNAPSRLETSESNIALRKNRGIGIFLVVAVLIFEIAALYLSLGYYDDFYDEGVYLQSARMMLRGYHLYSDIFYSQPPLGLPLIYFSFRLFGQSFFVAQSVMVAMAVVAVVSAVLATRQLADWMSAALAAGVMVLSPMELWISHTVTPVVPAIALSTAAMAFAIHYARRGSRVSLCLAAILVTGSILTKVLGVFTLPGVMLMAGARHWNTAGISWIQRGKLLLRDSSVILGIAATLIAVTLFEFGAINVWQQAVEFHWAARSNPGTESAMHQISSIASLVTGNCLVGTLSLCAIASIFAGAEGIALLGWTLFTFVGLLFHRPLFNHHLVILIPPIAITGAVGWERLPEAVERLRNRWKTITPRSIEASVFLVQGAVIMVLIATLVLRIAAKIIDPQPLTFPADIVAAQMIQRLTPADQAILTDAQSIAFLADRDVPPELTDTSFVRIGTGYLTLEEVIAYSNRYDVRLVLLWNRRLASIPGLTQWLRARFPYHKTLGMDRELFSYVPTE